MTKKNLSEGLRRGDLEDQVLPMISFDEYESNFGDTALTIAFYIHGKDAATDFNKFLQKSHVNFLTTDISPSQDKDGYYAVFVEFKIDDKLIANFFDIIEEVNNLTLIEEWQIHLNNRELMALSKKALEFYIHAKYERVIMKEDVQEDTSVEQKAKAFIVKNLEHLSKYYSLRDFKSEDAAREFYFNSLEKDDKSPWVQAMPSSFHGTELNKAISLLVPIYKAGKNFRIGKAPKKVARDPWAEIDVTTPSLAPLQSVGILNPFDGYKVKGVKMLSINDINMTEDHSYTTGGVKKVEWLAEKIKENGKFTAIIVNQDYSILDGHHRFRAIRDYLRYKTIPALVIEINDGTNESYLIEGSGEEVTFENVHIDFHHDQHDYELRAIILGKVVGYIRYVVYQDEVHLSMIKVHEDYRRKGIATQLVKHLQKMFPNTEIQKGSMTDDGSKLFGVLPTHTVVDPNYAPKFKRHEEVKNMLKKYSDDFEAMSDKSTFMDTHSDWNDLHDENDKLDQELYGKKPTKTIFKV
jgi:GNAT superfamily N-acetyltransferase